MTNSADQVEGLASVSVPWTGVSVQAVRRIVKGRGTASGLPPLSQKSVFSPRTQEIKGTIPTETKPLVSPSAVDPPL